METLEKTLKVVLLLLEFLGTENPKKNCNIFRIFSALSSTLCFHPLTNLSLKYPSINNAGFYIQEFDKIVVHLDSSLGEF